MKQSRVENYNYLRLNTATKICTITALLWIVASSFVFAQTLQHISHKSLLENSAGYKCGFPDILSLHEQGVQLQKRRVVSFEDSIVSASGRFVVHFDRTTEDSIPGYDRDGNGTPDYLEFLTASLDRAWEIEVNQLGFEAPPDSTGGPTDTYHVFCEDLPFGFYGLTSFNDSDAIPSDPGVARFQSTISIATDFSFVDYPELTADPIVRDSLAIAVTAAHEFNHACQLGYRIWFDELDGIPDLWFIENSATYMEEVVADEVNDYYFYIQSFYESTFRYIGTNFGNRIYGQGIFPVMLGQQYGAQITREIWEEIRNRQAVEAIDHVLSARGSSLDESYRELAVWIYFTGYNSIPGEFFEEASNYPDPFFVLTGDLISENDASIEMDLAGYAFRLFQTPIQPNSIVQANLTVPSASGFWSYSTLDFIPPFSEHYSPNQLHPVESALNSSALDQIVYSGNRGKSNPELFELFQINLQRVGSGAQVEVRVGPNIIRPESEIHAVNFVGVPSGGRVEILSSNGVHLRTLESAGANLQWDLQNSSGDDVGNGVYVYRIISGETRQSGKIIVVK